MDFNQLINDLESRKITPYQIYNIDIDYSQFFSVDHYIKNQKDDIDINQKIQKVFLDIEVYSENKFDFNRIEFGEHPISCCTIFSNYEKVFHVFLLLIKKNIEIWNNIETNKVEYFKQQLIENEYIKEGEFDIVLKTYTNDLPLIKDVWGKIHELDPVVLTGFNSDNFDFPYIFYRLKNLYNNDLKSVSKVLSRFGDVNITSFGGDHKKVRFNEYINADLSYLYRPRDDGGLNLGRKQPSYSLDFISEFELKKKKLDYKDDGISLDVFYEQDPLNFTLYNIIDTCLTYQLEQKLKLIDQYNMYRRLMRSPLDNALRGPTAVFDTLVYYNLTKDKNYVRFGINEETQQIIEKEEIAKIPKLLSHKNIKWNITNIDNRTFLKITRKFEGAYVKNSPGKVYTNEDGLIIDLDASLPPWERIFIKRNNKIFWKCIGEYTFEEGDETLTWDKDNNTCWKKVLGKTEHEWDKEIVTIVTETSKRVTVTGNHSIFGIEKHAKTNTPYLIDANNLEVGDKVVGFTNFDYLIRLEKIVDIRKKHYKGLVYDISVEETERFFAGTGIGVHNTSLYPSMIRQNNISFDTYFGRILDPQTTGNAFQTLEKLILNKKDKNIREIVYGKFLDLIVKYINSDKINVQNANDTIQQYYIVMCFLLNKIVDSNISTLREIFNPKSYQHYILLKKYFIPLLNLIDEIHPKNCEYNNFCYDYLLGGEISSDSVNVIEDINLSKIRITQVLSEDLEKYLKKNQLIITLTGCLFYKHEKKLSLFAGWLEKMASLRKQYIKERDKFKKDEDEYSFFNARQLATKTAMNTSYGLYGQSTFRWSNNWLAKTITCQGRLTLKISQQVAEEYLREIKNE